MFELFILFLIFSFFYSSSSTFTKLYEESTSELINQHIILRYISSNNIYFSVPSYHAQYNFNNNIKNEFDLSTLPIESKSSFYPILINGTPLQIVFFSSSMIQINVNNLNTNTSSSFSFPLSDCEIIQMEMFDNQYALYLAHCSTNSKPLWFGRVQIISSNAYYQGSYASSSGTIITGNFLHLDNYIIIGVLIQENGHTYYIFNFYSDIFSVIQLAGGGQLINSSYMNQIHFRMIYLDPFVILCSITSDYIIICYSLSYLQTTPSFNDFLSGTFIQMLHCNSQSYYFPLYKFTDNYAILACNSSPISITIFDAQLNEKLVISSDTTDNYILFELTPLYDKTIYLIGMQTTSSGYILYGDVIKYSECTDISAPGMYYTINRQIYMGNYFGYYSTANKIEFLSLPFFDIINKSTSSVITVGDIVKATDLTCFPPSIGKSSIKYNIINDYDSFAKYKITNCIIEAFVCVRGCTDCTGDDQNICKTCYTGYVKASINGIDACIEVTQTDGYYLSNGVYYQCMSKCATCKQLGDENDSKCLTCKEGYIKENGKDEDNCILNPSFLFECEDFTQIIPIDTANTMSLIVNKIGSTVGTTYRVDIYDSSNIGTFYVIGDDSTNFIYNSGSNSNGFTETAKFDVKVNGVASSNVCNIKIIVCKDGCGTNCNEDNYCIKCKDNYYYYYENGEMTCIQSCSGEYKYYSKETMMCYKECPRGKETNSNDECINISNIPIDIITGNTNMTKEEISSIKDNNILDLLEIGKDIIGDDYIVQVYPSNKPPEDNNTISKIDLGECENILRKEYDIDSNELLIIYKIDIESKKSITNKVEYSVYSIDGIPLDISKCKNSPVIIVYPIINTNGIDLESGRVLFEENGVDVFNIEDDFFHNLCFPYLDKNGNDVILRDRRKDIFQKVDFCDDGCKYKGINYTTNTVKCSCNITHNTNSNENIIDTTKGAIKDAFTSINLLVVKCFNLMRWKYLNKNIGFWFGIIIMLTELGMIVLYVLVGKNVLYYKLSVEYKNNSPTSQIGEKDYAIATKVTTLMLKEASIEETFETTSQKDKSTFDFITEKKFIDNTPYSKAIIKENRNYLIVLWEYIKEHNIFCRIFLHKTGFELFPLHLSLFIFSLSLSFSLNGLFLNDKDISKKYKGELTYIATLLRAIYSCLIGVILLQIVQMLMNYSLMLHTLLVEIKEKKILLLLLSKYMRKVRIKITLIFVIESILMIVFWYFMITFCAVYPGSQLEWFKGGWTSFLITFFTSFGISLSVCILRYCGITYKSSKLYNCSIYLKQLIIG